MRLSLVYRVHWLRAYARHERWKEEMDITRNEMTWTVNSFRHKAKVWAGYADSSARQSPGHRYYADRQCAFWEHLADNALQSFQRALASSGERPETVLINARPTGGGARNETHGPPCEDSVPREDPKPDPRETEPVYCTNTSTPPSRSVVT